MNRYRCVACGGVFPGRRQFCIRCTQAGIEAAAERVPCGNGHTRRPERPCVFCSPEERTEAAIPHTVEE
jgi:hypothetical protein